MQLLCLEHVHPAHEFLVGLLVVGNVLELEGLSLERQVLELRQRVADRVLICDGILC